jgi:CheY-like chemotaxis protein
VRSAVHILQLPNATDNDTQRAKGIIARQVGIMARLIDDLMDVSRISRGHIELRREPVELGRVIELAVEASRPQILEQGHELTISIPPEPILLEGDVMRLAQVFVNLLTNSAKYTERGGRIEVSTRVESDQLIVTVEDDGIGIPAAQIDRVFEMFSQAEDALSRSRGGLGIGLSLVKHLVQLHGGEVHAESEGRGRGSRFIVSLPLPRDACAPVAAAAASETPVYSQAAPLRILVVDDNQDGAETMTQLLSCLGHDVRLALDGEQALEVADQFHPELMLLDIGLPKITGYEVCRQIRARSWGGAIMIVAMTGWGDADAQRQAREAGFDRHLVKPAEETALMDTLATARATRK